MASTPDNKYLMQKRPRKNSPQYQSWYGWRKDTKSKKYKDWVKKINQSKHLRNLRLRKQKIIEHG
jgi:hypothetical protein